MSAKITATSLSRVISASRRVDMVAGDPDAFIQILKNKAVPSQTHTLVIWTKNPMPILRHRPLFRQLSEYEQLFLHLSITGLGGSDLEPRVPSPNTVLPLLPELIALLKSPERIRIRFDPIIHMRDAEGRAVENLHFFDALAPQIAQAGINQVSISWVQIYPKVASRLCRKNWQVIEISAEQQKIEQNYIQETAQKFGLQVHGCCVPGWPRSKCIDGELFTRLHPLGRQASTHKAKGQRAACGCTESLDIGWYYPCRHGCLYCYGRPLDKAGISIARP
jgi:DNA repair photolyase